MSVFRGSLKNFHLFYRTPDEMIITRRKLRKVNITRSPGGTPLVSNRNKENGTGLTPMMTKALQRKFQVNKISFENTLIYWLSSGRFRAYFIEMMHKYFLIVVMFMIYSRLILILHQIHQQQEARYILACKINT